MRGEDIADNLRDSGEVGKGSNLLLIFFFFCINMIMGLINGKFPEWSNGADCKSVGSAFVGSNPSLPKKLYLFLVFDAVRRP